MKAGTEPLTAEGVIARLKELDESVRSLECSFRQSLAMTETGLTQESEGKLYYLKPDRMRLEYSKPRKQVTVSDKKDIWIHQLEENQVIRANWNDWKRTQFNVTGLLDFGNYSAILEKHTVEVEHEPGRPARVTLRPKEKSAYALILLLSADDLFPVRWSLQLDRMKIETEIMDLRRNGELPEELFRFTPPAGAPVINFAGPRVE